jgi:hypothetical protein
VWRAVEPAERGVRPGEPEAADDPDDPDGLGRTEGLVRGGVGAGLEATAVGCGRVAGLVPGLNVATESIAPATRQTARMLASSGRMVPCPAKGDVSRRSRLRRRRARNSLW